MRLRTSIVAVSIVSMLVTACSSGGTVNPTSNAPVGDAGAELDATRLIALFQSSGISVERAGTFVADPFSGTSTAIRVDGHAIQLYEYETATDAAHEAAFISKDGGSITAADGTVFAPHWNATPHFFLVGRVLVQYIGDDAAIIGLLESVLGPQFAGGKAEFEPRLVIGDGDPPEGAPMSFEEAALQAEQVVLAEVTDVEPGPTYYTNVELPSCVPSQLISVVILEIYKGDLAPGASALIHQTSGLTDAGTGCGDDPSAEVVLQVMADDPLYDVGQRYLLALSPLAGYLEHDTALAEANAELTQLVNERNPGQVLFNGRLLVEQADHPDLRAADVMHVALDGRGRAIPGLPTGDSLAEFEEAIAEVVAGTGTLP